MQVIDIQRALFHLGFNPGELDGIWGRRTIMAVKAFQRSRGLTVDGIVGPLTAQELMGTSAVAGAMDAASTPLIWYEEAINLLGTKEVEGTGSNRRILKWAKNLNIDYSGDDIPWCGLFVAHCVGSTLPNEELPPHPLGARNWRKFGESCEPMRGAIMVFWRGKREGALGHVGFYHSEDAQSFHVLGGNQSDNVNVARIARNRLLDARWPSTAKILTGAKVVAEAEGEMSGDEA